MTHLNRLIEEQGMLGSEQLTEALRRQRIYGGSLDTVLLELELVDPHTMGDLLEQACGFPIAPPELLRNGLERPWDDIPEDMQRSRWVEPLAIEGDEIVVAVHPDLPDQMLGKLLRSVRRLVPMVTPECCMEKIAAERHNSVIPQRYAILCAAYINAVKRRPSVSGSFTVPEIDDPRARSVPPATKASVVLSAPISPSSGPTTVESVDEVAERPTVTGSIDLHPPAPTSLPDPNTSLSSDPSARDLEAIAERIGAASEVLKQACNRDDAIEALVDAAMVLSSRIGLFRVHHHTLVGLSTPRSALGDLGGSIVEASSPDSAVQQTLSKGSFHGTIGQATLLRIVGIEPSTPCALYRIDVRERPVAVLYLDNDGAALEPILLEHLATLVDLAGQVFEAILRTRRQSGPTAAAAPPTTVPAMKDPPTPAAAVTSSQPVTGQADPWHHTPSSIPAPPQINGDLSSRPTIIDRSPVLPTAKRGSLHTRPTLVDHQAPASPPPLKVPTVTPPSMGGSPPRPKTSIKPSTRDTQQVATVDDNPDGDPSPPSPVDDSTSIDDTTPSARSHRPTILVDPPTSTTTTQTSTPPPEPHEQSDPSFTNRADRPTVQVTAPPLPPVPPPPPSAVDANDHTDHRRPRSPTIHGLPPPELATRVGMEQRLDTLPPTVQDDDDIVIIPLAQPIVSTTARGRIELEDEDWMPPSSPLTNSSEQNEIDRVIEAVIDGDAPIDRLQALGSHGLSRLIAQFPGPLEVLRRDLRSLPPPSAHGPLVRTVIALGEPIVPYVLDLFEHPNPDIRFYAGFVFHELRDERCLQPLALRAFDSNDDIRVISMRVLETYRRTKSFEDAAAIVRERLRHSSRTVQLYAARAAGTLRDTGGISELIELLSSSDRFIQEASLESLCSITGQQHGLKPHRWHSWYQNNRELHRVEWIIDSLRHRDLPVRRWAADELVRITGNRVPFSPMGDKRAREIAAQAWTDWWEEQGRIMFTG